MPVQRFNESLQDSAAVMANKKGNQFMCVNGRWRAKTSSGS